MAPPITWSSMDATRPVNTVVVADKLCTPAEMFEVAEQGNDKCQAHCTHTASPRLLQLLPPSVGISCDVAKLRGSLVDTFAAPAPTSLARAISTLQTEQIHVRPSDDNIRVATMLPSSPFRVKAKAVAAGAPAAATATATDASLSWQSYQTFFCVCPDDCNSTTMYYLGSYDVGGSVYNLEQALGPFPLDLGDIFYAPNTLMDPQVGWATYRDEHLTVSWPLKASRLG